MKKSVVKTACAWALVYGAIVMVLFGLSGWFLCNNLGDISNNLLIGFICFTTYISSLTVGFIIFIAIYNLICKKSK